MSIFKIVRPKGPPREEHIVTAMNLVRKHTFLVPTTAPDECIRIAQTILVNWWGFEMIETSPDWILTWFGSLECPDGFVQTVPCSEEWMADRDLIELSKQEDENLDIILFLTDQYLASLRHIKKAIDEVLASSEGDIQLTDITSQIHQDDIKVLYKILRDYATETIDRTTVSFVSDMIKLMDDRPDAHAFTVVLNLLQDLQSQQSDPETACATLGYVGLEGI